MTTPAAPTDEAPTIHVCGAATHYRWRTSHCPTCGFETILVEAYPNSPWYEPHFTCTSCGEQWIGGWRMDRPFARGWRQQNITNATRDFEDKACQCPVEMAFDDGDCIGFKACPHEQARTTASTNTSDTAVVEENAPTRR